MGVTFPHSGHAQSTANYHFTIHGLERVRNNNQYRDIIAMTDSKGHKVVVCDNGTGVSLLSVLSLGPRTVIYVLFVLADTVCSREV